MIYKKNHDQIVVICKYNKNLKTFHFLSQNILFESSLLIKLLQICIIVGVVVVVVPLNHFHHLP